MPRDFHHGLLDPGMSSVPIGSLLVCVGDAAERPPVRAIVLRGAESGFGRPAADPSGDQARFPALVARRIIDGAGHDLPAQRPDAVSAALLELLT